MKAYGLATLGRDAELRHLPDGNCVANLSLAFSYGRKDAATGRKPTQWVDGSLWGKAAEALTPYLVKGGKVVASLSDVRIETFVKGDGTPGFKLAARVDGIELAGSPREGGAPAPAPAPARAPAPAARTAAPADFDDLDDVPF